ncbi:hypothetical protein NDU88_008243 [Pleurodeles waltl]|uniref:Uncharacterized protein n=1 Tax=Pleurodeles waltl TaxID=8319 RepID=A0AAV7N8K2_PLEWA|nr:hypothetical protein NDU88_008243 [Pleurodeles waltl]
MRARPREHYSLYEAQQSGSIPSLRSANTGAKSGGPSNGAEPRRSSDQGLLPWHRRVPQGSGELLAPEAPPRHPWASTSRGEADPDIRPKGQWALLARAAALCTRGGFSGSLLPSPGQRSVPALTMSEERA